MVVLHNRLGKCIHIEIAAWVRLLARAQHFGWQPKGTERPPVNLDLETPKPERGWSPMCYLPHGQLVRARDAVSLAEALGNAGERGAVVSFLGSCRVGGFLICSPNQQPGHSSTESTASGLAQLSVALGQSVVGLGTFEEEEVTPTPNVDSR